MKKNKETLDNTIYVMAETWTEIEGEMSIIDEQTEGIIQAFKERSEYDIKMQEQYLLSSAIETTEETTRTGVINGQVQSIRNRQIEKTQEEDKDNKSLGE